MLEQKRGTHSRMNIIHRAGTMQEDRMSNKDGLVLV